MIAIFWCLLHDGQPPTVYGTGRQTRDYVYVDDVVAGLQALLANSDATGVYNVGTGVPSTVLAIIEALADTSDAPFEPTFVPERPGEIEHSCLDVTRAKADLQWSAQVTLAEGLERTAHWTNGDVLPVASSRGVAVTVRATDLQDVAHPGGAVFRRIATACVDAGGMLAISLRCFVEPGTLGLLTSNRALRRVITVATLREWIAEILNAATATLYEEEMIGRFACEMRWLGVGYLLRAPDPIEAEPHDLAAVGGEVTVPADNAEVVERWAHEIARSAEIAVWAD